MWCSRRTTRLCATEWRVLVMRASGLAFTFLSLRSRLSGRLAHSNHACMAAVGPSLDPDATRSDNRNILILDPASSNCFHDLEAEGFQVTAAHGMSDAELEDILRGYDAVVVRSANRVTRSMLAASPRVAVVGRAGSGVDNIDLDAAIELGVAVVNAPTGNAGSVAELVLGLMLSISRSLPRAHDTIKRGEWAKKDFSGRTLKGKILGIVGFGSVGQELAKLGIALGMVVMIANGNRSPPPGGEQGNDQSKAERAALAKEVGVTGPPLPLDELLSKSDFLSLHLPLTAETRGMIAERELALMKTSAVIINAARGGVVDEKDLAQALMEGRLGGAGLDVFGSEKAPLQDHVINLCRLPNVVCTPHIGGSTEEAGERVLSEVCSAVVDTLKGTLPQERFVIGSPDTNLRITRLCEQ